MLWRMVGNDDVLEVSKRQMLRGAQAPIETSGPVVDGRYNRDARAHAATAMPTVVSTVCNRFA